MNEMTYVMKLCQNSVGIKQCVLNYAIIRDRLARWNKKVRLFFIPIPHRNRFRRLLSKQKYIITLTRQTSKRYIILSHDKNWLQHQIFQNIISNGKKSSFKLTQFQRKWFSGIDISHTGAQLSMYITCVFY